LEDRQAALPDLDQQPQDGIPVHSRHAFCASDAVSFNQGSDNR
jgi:hypothetical protein